MERVHNTGIKPLGREFCVKKSGAVLLVNSTGCLSEIVWWPSAELAKEIYSTYDEYFYFIDEDGYLARK